MRAKELAELGLQRLKGDEPVYYKKDKDGNLKGMISTWVDYFDLAGKDRFVEIREKERAVLDVSKDEDDKVRYPGINIKKVRDGIEIYMMHW